MNHYLQFSIVSVLFCLCSGLNTLDYDVFVRGMEKSTCPLILWNPARTGNYQVAFESPVELAQPYPGFCAKSKLFLGYDGPLFKSAELGNYQILAEFPGNGLALQLPLHVRQLLSNSGSGDGYVGAYPAIE